MFITQILIGLAVTGTLAALFGWFWFIYCGNVSSHTARQRDEQRTRAWRNEIDDEIRSDYQRRPMIPPSVPVSYSCSSGSCGRCHDCRGATSVPVRFIKR